MLRFAAFVGLLLALVGGLFALGVAGSVGARVMDGPGPCTYVPLAFSLNGAVPVESSRAFTPGAGESYLQFTPGLPITATGSSSGAVLLYNTFSGTASGGITGTFVISNLNGLAVTGSTISPEARGILVNEVVVSDGTGSMDLVLALNFAATTAVAPYYPRNISGYVQAVSMTGGYAPYSFVGTVSGNMGPPSGGMVSVSLGISGRLYEGYANQNLSHIFAGSRVMIPNKPVTFQISDVLARFFVDDEPAGSTVGNLNPVSVFTGTTNGNITSTFALSTHSLLVGDSLTFSPGWIAGNFRGVSPAGDVYYGPWIGDLPGVSFHSYFFQVGGTGAFGNSHVYFEDSGAIAYQGGQDIAGGGGGYFCTDMVNVGPTGTPTSTPVATSTATVAPSATRTATAVPTGTATQTSTAVPTQTQGGATATVEPTGTSTAVSTATLAATSTAVATNTPTTIPASPTATACTLHFQDVEAGSTFYSYVMCLACRGIVNGYACGGVGEPCGGSGDPYFRPGNSVTRGQAAKIVGLAAGFGQPVSGQTFEDVMPGSTFYEYAERMAVMGIMSGYACGGVGEPCVGLENRPYFRPNVTASRGQLAKIVCGANGCTEPVIGQTFEDVPPGSTFYEAVQKLAARGVFVGYACGGVGEPCVSPDNRPYFRPGNVVTRGQISKIVITPLLGGCEAR